MRTRGQKKRFQVGLFEFPSGKQLQNFHPVCIFNFVHKTAFKTILKYQKRNNKVGFKPSKPFWLKLKRQTRKSLSKDWAIACRQEIKQIRDFDAFSLKLQILRRFTCKKITYKRGVKIKRGKSNDALSSVITMVAWSFTSFTTFGQCKKLLIETEFLHLPI